MNRYHVKFGSSATKGVRIKYKGTPKLGSASVPPRYGRGVDYPLKYTAPPRVILPNLVVLSNGTSVNKEIRLKNLTIVSRLSRSLKLGHRNRHVGLSIRRL